MLDQVIASAILGPSPAFNGRVQVTYRTKSGKQRERTDANSLCVPNFELDPFSILFACSALPTTRPRKFLGVQPSNKHHGAPDTREELRRGDGERRRHRARGS